jgi:hypothetical protein
MDGPRLKFFTRAIMKKFAERISIIWNVMKNA